MIKFINKCPFFLFILAALFINSCAKERNSEKTSFVLGVLLSADGQHILGIMQDPQIPDESYAGSFESIHGENFIIYDEGKQKFTSNIESFPAMRLKDGTYLLRTKVSPK
jgi:hypothetical protein